jgi:hypothetical protein
MMNMFFCVKDKKSTAIFPMAHVCVKSLALEKNQQVNGKIDAYKVKRTK